MRFTIGHIFCGIGGKAIGAAAAVATYGDVAATFETIGGIDVDPLACRDFESLTGAPSLCADVHDLEPAALREFFGRTAPDVVMMSPPCKGFSGLLSAKRAALEKYQRMNSLMERALFLVCSSWARPPKLVFVENVPRIQSRGRATIRRCLEMGRAHGYAIAQGNHDCGELGGLAQHRRRYFQLWRHLSAVPQMVYEPPKMRVRACGEVLGPLPMPGDLEAAGPMHAVPRLSWRNWVRLSLIPAGGDWRDLPGVLAEGQARREVFRRDPVTSWEEPAETVTGPGGSAVAAVADPRVTGNKPAWQRVAGVTDWSSPAPTITAGAKIHAGAFQVADPRIGCSPRAGAYRVLRWEDAAATITGSLSIDNGAAAVADPRSTDKPPPFTPMIIAADGTWHRPLTTLELAALQGFPTTIDGRPLVLAGSSHTRWREAIGNAVPPPAAQAIGEQLLRALLLSALGAFEMSAQKLWVAPPPPERNLNL